MPLKWFSKGGNQRQELVSNNDSKGSNQNHELVPIDDDQTTQQIHQEDSDKKSDKEINVPSNYNDISEITSDPQTAREQWSGQFDFLMSMIAYAVGLGNVWRFPYLCYKNGGGSFLVVYAIFFAFAAVPIFIMEVTVGQYLQRGAMEVWKMCPIFKGVGIGNVVIAFMCISYFCVIVSWAVFYMMQSLGATFDETFPWETCGNQWNDNKCITGKETPAELDQIKSNLKQIGANLTVNQKVESSVEQYWEHRVLHQTSTISDFGGIQWELLVIMFVSWMIVYFALWKGITKARKFVYFCAIFPYFLIAIMLIRGVTLDGASIGISFYLTPNLTKFTEITVWKDAGTQVFYSYGVGFGTLIALGSHNKFTHNCYRDAIILCFINGMTSILAGFAIFSTLGFMSLKAKKAMADIVEPGVGLAFKVYPQVASHLPMKQFWAFLFFLMIIILGLDSQVCMMEGLLTAMEDTFPILRRRYKKISLLVTCFFFFLIGIPMVTYAGVHWLTLVDDYGASGIALLFVVFFEVVGLAWGFGAHRVRAALKEMLGFYPVSFLTILWKYTAPLISLILFFCCLIMYKPTEYPNGQKYPAWAEVFGFCLSACSMVVIPGYGLYYMFRKRKDKLTPIQGIHPPPKFDIVLGLLDNGKDHQHQPSAADDEELELIDDEHNELELAEDKFV